MLLGGRVSVELNTRFCWIRLFWSLEKRIIYFNSGKKVTGVTITSVMTNLLDRALT